MTWLVIYTAKTGKAVNKVYANMNTASSAVDKLARQGIAADMTPNL